MQRRRPPSVAVLEETPVRGVLGDLVLTRNADGVELREASMSPGGGLRIDFTHMALRGRSALNLSRRQPLARAMGRGSRRIIDATAGLGHDAILLAAMGFEVIAIERHPVLAKMLEEALRRATSDPATAKLIGGRLQIVQADAREALSHLGETRGAAAAADCVYLDPMFPPRRKASALAKKDIRLIRALVGDDDDAADLLAVARQCARRVAVKRPDHAEPLAADPTTSIVGKLVRYDVYVQKGSTGQES